MRAAAATATAAGLLPLLLLLYLLVISYSGQLSFLSLFLFEWTPSWEHQSKDEKEEEKLFGGLVVEIKSTAAASTILSMPQLCNIHTYVLLVRKALPGFDRRLKLTKNKA